MIVELFPFLADIERALAAFCPIENNPLWGKGKDARNALINATISKFDRQLQAASTDDLAAYAEGLKPHLQKAMTSYWAGDIWTDYQSTIADCHRHLSFAFLALIVRAYDRKKATFIASDYAASAGIEDITALSAEVTKAANKWGIFHSPTIAQLLAGIREKSKAGPKEYNLLTDFPAAETYLNRLVPAYLKDDHSLQDGTSKANAAIIAYTIAGELNISEVCKYFEQLWGITDLAGARKQVKARKNELSTLNVLRSILRKKLPGANGETEDTDKVNKYIKQYS